MALVEPLLTLGEHSFHSSGGEDFLIYAVLVLRSRNIWTRLTGGQALEFSSPTEERIGMVVAQQSPNDLEAKAAVLKRAKN